MALLLRPLLPRQERNAATMGLAAAAAIAVDIDAIGRPFGGGDIAFLGGHRALTHSVAAGVVIAAAGAAVLAGRKRASSFKGVFPYLAAVVMSHGLLDMLTTYGEGIQLFAPFSTRPFAFPWKPFNSALVSEILILWVPALLLLVFRQSEGKTSRASARFAFASLALGLIIGLLDLRTPRQVSNGLSIVAERRRSAGRLTEDSTKRLIAAAEAAGASRAAARGRALTSERRCVEVRDTDAIAVSGDITAGGWAGYRESWMLGFGGLWWRTTRGSVGPADTLRVHVRPISRSGDTLVFALTQHRRQTAFRAGVRVPTPGAWLFVATMGDEWGCFIFRV